MTKNLKTNAFLLLALVLGALMVLVGLAQFSVTNIARSTREVNFVIDVAREASGVKAVDVAQEMGGVAAVNVAAVKRGETESDAKNELTSAKAVCVIERNSGRVLYSKNEYERLPMASLTKIITAIVAIENNADLDRVIEIPKEATGIEGSTIYLKAGEHLSIRDLLFGLMLRSGNDAAVALAIATSGSVDAFMTLANDFVARLGLVNTHLVTPNGLHDDNHFTSALDLARVTAYALENPTFAEIVKTQKTVIPNEFKANENRLLKNKNKLLAQFEYADGVKTGYTKKAGRCFVGSATRNGMQLVCVLLDCKPMFEECAKLLERGFEEFELVDLLSAYDVCGKIKVTNADETEVGIFTRSEFVYPLTAQEKSNVHITRNLPESVAAPIKKNQEVGQLEINLGNDLIFCEKIYTINSVESNDLKSKIEKILQGFL